MKHSIPELPEFILSDEALPASLREFVRVLGLAGCLRLLAMAQGGRVAVPKKPQEDDPRRAAMGEDAYLAMVKGYGGETVDVPKADAFLRQIRHQQVQFYRESGMTMDEIATQTGYSKRWVIEILQGGADGRDVHTMDLFEPPQPIKPLPQSLPKLPRFSAHDPFGMTQQRA